MKNIVKKILLISVICTFLLTGCSSGRKDAKAVTEEFLTSFQQLDSSANELLANTEVGSELKFQGVQASLAQRMTFDIGKCKKNKEGYIVEVVVTTVDFAKEFEILNDEFSENGTEEEALEAISKRLSSSDASMRDFKLKIPVVENHDTFQIVMTAELENALSGGYHEYINELVEEMLYD